MILEENDKSMHFVALAVPGQVAQKETICRAITVLID